MSVFREDSGSDEGAEPEGDSGIAAGSPTASAMRRTLARRKTDDAGMLELLAPYAGHRYRVTRLIELGGSGPPRRGPRMSVRDYRSI